MQNPVDPLPNYFPVASQTTESDRAFLLAILELFRTRDEPFNYLEIGSFLGGTLAPFLLIEQCTHVLSVDDRERQQADERGALYDYHGVTSETMIESLRTHGVPTLKLEVHDGNVETLPPLERKYDVAFIDAEHTDDAVFRDFLYVLDHMKPDSIVAFHDSSLVSKALVNILTLLRKGSQAAPASLFRFFKKTDSEMSGIFLGKFSQFDLTAFGQEEPMTDFLRRSAQHVLRQKIKHQVTFDVSWTVHDPKIRKAY